MDEKTEQTPAYRDIEEEVETPTSYFEEQAPPFWKEYSHTEQSHNQGVAFPFAPPPHPPHPPHHHPFHQHHFFGGGKAGNMDTRFYGHHHPPPPPPPPPHPYKMYSMDVGSKIYHRKSCSIKKVIVLLLVLTSMIFMFFMGRFYENRSIYNTWAHKFDHKMMNGDHHVLAQGKHGEHGLSFSMMAPPPPPPPPPFFDGHGKAPERYEDEWKNMHQKPKDYTKQHGKPGHQKLQKGHKQQKEDDKSNEHVSKDQTRKENHKKESNE